MERAVIDRIVALGMDSEDRERVVRAAIREVDDQARKPDSEAELIRRRLTAVQAEIQNLVAVLKQVGQQGLASVQEELVRLESERAQLRKQLQRLTQQEAPLSAATAAARQFIQTWEDVGQLFQQATLDEQRTILQHYVEVVEVRISVSFRQACMNSSEACGTVGCRHRTLWRTADEYQEEMRPPCAA